jgi:thiamine-monophosphate kinase
MGGGAEFDLIRRLLDTWGPRASGIGDDAAVLGVPPGEQLVASTDASVENVHFKRGWMTPREIGARAATAALSDLAAMGARPLGLLLALGLPESWQAEAEAIADGVTRSSELTLTVTVLGGATRPLSRAGARVGDNVFVTGHLGGPGAALADLLNNREPEPSALSRFIAPTARIAEGRWLAGQGATALIDISDGLLADAGHLANASAVSLSIDVDAVPCLRGVLPADVLSSGEEYELLVIVPADVGLDPIAFERAFGIPLTHVGVVVERQAESVITATTGVALSGHDHLAR